MTLLTNARALFAAFCVTAWLPQQADAQPILQQRCSADSRNPSQAEARLHWARRCALTTHVIAPGAYYDTYAPAANGGTLKDYTETDSSSNWSGMNAYTSQGDNFEVNASLISKLYMSGPTYQGLDANGYYEWWRPAARRKSRPLYPVFGNHYDLYSPSNQQLYPHPQLLNCSFYHDPNGTVLAAGSSFYVNGLCEAAPSSDRCTIDRLSVREAKERIDWARQCGLRQNVGPPSAWFDTGLPALDQSTTLKDYSETAAPDNRRYSGPSMNYEVNAAYVSSLYKSGTSAYQGSDAQGYYKWGRDPGLMRQRPLYPIFGTSPDINSGALLTPGLGSDCNLYSSTGTASSFFYVNKYCESIY
ncbi:hypothetical protein [Stigmatella erecta]|uniref:Uncharacterized protein n=1 Tax=Stigmatella erecta TaxID=83460 RepID=A0A1I0JRN2_9BACT|nr:hypothetical protein [Stigmatella erecta]SEU13366.1 hypothetical protein SAMN05443639_10841 [Stigmatella erecta]